MERIGIFGGSFDPVHNEHVAAVRAAAESLQLNRVFVVPSHIAPHKTGGANASGADRLTMCRLAFEALPYVAVDDSELTGGGTSYTYLTCRAFRERFPDAALFFLVGADMLEDFFTWRNPDDILKNVTLAAFSRGEEGVCALHEKFVSRFRKDFCEVPFCGKDISSTAVRVKIAFGKQTDELSERVRAYIDEKGLYTHPAIAPALALEKEERVEHSYRVALLAARLAPKYKVAQSKAILASALHDCAKYVPLSSPLLMGFATPDDVPSPVLHQYTGAYLAEHEFHITDEEVLDAIRYHTSGRENMSPLGKLIFLADMLEEGRSFEGVERLRELFYEDIDACLKEALFRQVAYLKATGKPVYPLTQRAYDWILNHEI